MMHALKTPSFFRPSSRPASPVPTAPLSRADSTSGPDATPKPHTKLSLSNFRKPPTAPALTSTPSLLIQDGSYLEALSLKLSEAVSKALAQPTCTTGAGDVLNGKRPIPAGRGYAFGALIAAELNASHGNVHLQRAILRLLQRPLSVVLTNLSNQLLPLLSSPAFLTPSAPTVMNPNPNATQLHALSLSQFAGELIESFDGLNLDAVHDARGDGLKATKDGLASLVGRVVNPLVAGIKNELVPLVQALENPNPTSVVSTSPKPIGGAKVTVLHPAISTLSAVMPIYARALIRYTTTSSCQTTLATLLISLVWRGLVALSHRPSPPRPRSNSVSAIALTSSGMLKKRLGAGKTPPTTPPSTPPPSKFAIKLPPSRPPSPPAPPIPSAAADARTLYDLLSMLPKPPAGNNSSLVAREAVDEAFEAVAALTALLGAVNNCGGVREDLDLELLTTGLPVLIALPLLIRWSGHGGTSTVPSMLGLSESAYREGCLSGFGRADECTSLAGERILEILGADNPDDTKTQMVVKWLETKLAAAH